MFGVKVNDAGAIKLVCRYIIRRFPVISRSPFSEAERIIRASRAGCRVMNIPVEVTPRTTGKSVSVRKDVVLLSLLDLWLVWVDIKIKPLLK